MRSPVRVLPGFALAAAVTGCAARVAPPAAPSTLVPSAPRAEANAPAATDFGPMTTGASAAPSAAGVSSPVAGGGTLNAPTNDASACAEVKTSAEAVGLFEKGCAHGDAKGCYLASLSSFCGSGVPRDLTKSATLATQACEHGVLEGCSNAGNLYEGVVDGPEADFPRAQKLFGWGCLGGDVLSCNNLGLLWMKPGPAQDAPKALELFDRLCTRGDLSACGNASVLLLGGGGIAADPSRAATLAGRACAGDASTGCNVLGSLYAKGAGGLPQSGEKARDSFSKACGLRDPSGCANLGASYAGAYGDQVDLPKAKEALKKGCDGGNAFACTFLGTLLSPSAVKP